jgi:Big-like domain-containing protein
MRGFFALLLSGAAVAACADQPAPTAVLQPALPGDSGGDTTVNHRPPGHVVTINVFPPAESVAVSDSAGFFADARDAAGNQVLSARFRWTVGDPTVARIEGDFGSSIILRALRSGSTTVTAQSQGTSGSSFLVVLESLPPPPDSNAVATVTVSPPVDSVAVGDSAGFLATLRDSLGNIVTGPAVLWSVSDSLVAQIEGVLGSSVLVRALSAGTATVTATSQGKSGSGTLIVQ